MNVILHHDIYQSQNEINVRYSSALIMLRIQNSLVFSILQQSTTIVKADLSSCKEYVQLTFFDTKVITT